MTTPVVDQKVPHYFRTLALVIPGLFLGIQISTWIFFLPGAIQGRADFRLHYAAAQMVRSGHADELYDLHSQEEFQTRFVSREQVSIPFLHPAYQVLLFLPLSYVSYRTSYLLFLAVNFGLLVLMIKYLGRRFRNLHRINPNSVAFLFLSFIPVGVALLQGQDSIVLLALFAASVSCLEKNEILAGVFIGLGLFKFQFVLIIAAMFLLRRRWGFMAGFALSATASAAISVAVMGLPQIPAYVSLIQKTSAPLSDSEQIRFGTYPLRMPNLRGLLSGATNLSQTAVRTAATVISSILLVVISFLTRRRGSIDALCIAMVASASLGYHLHIHDMSILLIPIAFALNDAVFNDNARHRLYAATVALLSPALIAFVPPSYGFLIAIPTLVFLATLVCTNPTSLTPTRAG
jgi:glycosyl transferase family 87